MLYFAAPKAAIRFGAFEAFDSFLSGDQAGGDRYAVVALTYPVLPRRHLPISSLLRNAEGVVPF
jgi:hypothetical protein